MSGKTTGIDNLGTGDDESQIDQHSDYQPADRFDASAVHHLSRVYEDWFLDYVSYVILERVVSHIEDGLGPVQWRILYSMKRMDDKQHNKVTNIVRHAMQFHPHGDVSVGDALVQMGQENPSVDTQGNWGNILTGDRATAPRYIEARLSKFALNVVFNPKTTHWQLSYDGRNKEPITLPAEFPLLLAQGTESIAVRLNSKIPPHNLDKIYEAAIYCLRGEKFRLYPDLPTGGSIDMRRCDGGQRGGALKARARIEKLDNKTLVIKEIPFSKATTALIGSMLGAIDKGKIKAKKMDDNTAVEVEIQVHLAPGVGSDKTIDVLYIFSDREISVSPNCCVIEDDKPGFLTVSDMLRHDVDSTMGLLRKELEIRKNELLEQLFFASLEKIFMEEHIYKDEKFEEAKGLDSVMVHVNNRLEPLKPNLIREVTRDDILRLLGTKMNRILKFSKDKAGDFIARTKAGIKNIDHDLAHITDVIIHWFEFIHDKYGKDHPRLTGIRSFETIETTKVVETNEKLYIDRQEGFVGTGLKKDEFVCNCSDADDIIVFYKGGKFKMIKAADRIFVDKNVIYVQVLKEDDKHAIYNIVYQDGEKGTYFIKRFSMASITRDRGYDLTQGEPGSRVMRFAINPNGEVRTIKVTLDPDPKKKKQSIFLEKDFSEVLIKGRGAKGSILTKKAVHHIGLKSHGHNTLDGRRVWFDPDINRINCEEHKRFSGEFNGDDTMLVVLTNGGFCITSFDPNSHYEDNVQVLEKWDERKAWSAVLSDVDSQNYPYVKRFMMEATKKRQDHIGDNPDSKLVFLTDEAYPRSLVTFGGNDATRPIQEVDVEEFIVVKGFRARGKRITTWEVDKAEELEPTRFPEPPTDERDNNPEEEGEGQEDTGASEENLDSDTGKSQQQVIDEISGQLSLFNDEDLG